MNGLVTDFRIPDHDEFRCQICRRVVLLMYTWQFKLQSEVAIEGQIIHVTSMPIRVCVKCTQELRKKGLVPEGDKGQVLPFCTKKEW